MLMVGKPSQGGISTFSEQELIVIQKIGVDADNFLKLNEFYLTQLKPELRYRREQSKLDSDWSPGRTVNTDEIALINVFNSGKRQGLAVIESHCLFLKKKGDNATAELQRRAKKEKKDAV